MLASLEVTQLGRKLLVVHHSYRLPVDQQEEVALNGDSSHLDVVNHLSKSR